MGMSKAWIYMMLAMMLFCVGAGGFAMNDNQPYLHAAQQGLETARIQLGKVTPDKGGHRAKAIGYINQALQEVKIAQVEHRNIGYTAAEDPK